MRRMVVPAVVLAMVATSCAAQTPPPRSALPDIPLTLEPEFLVRTDPFGILGDGDSCELLVGTGVRVLRVTPGSPADGVLAPGDVITAIEHLPTTTAESLQRVMAGRGPGGSVTLTVERRGEETDLEVGLIAMPGDPEQGRMGVEVESRLEVAGLEEPPALGFNRDLMRPMVVDQRLLFFDPIGAAWVPTAAELPSSRLAVVDSDVIVVAPGTTTLVRYSDGAAAAIDAGDWQFFAAIGHLGDLVLVSAVLPGAAADDPPVDSALLAVDFATQSIVWTWRPGSDGIDQIFLVDEAYANVDRSQAVVTLRSGSVEGARTFEFALLDANGNELSGWGTEERRFVPPGSVVGGWYDNHDIVYVTRDGDGALQAVLLDVGDGTRTPLVGLEEGLGGLWAVGDGRHLLLNQSGQLTLFDTVRELASRPVLSGCALTGIGNYGDL